MDELLNLAREAIELEFNWKKPEVSSVIKKKYSKKQACFVTLTINNKLRGCVGSLYPKQELWREVVDNSVNAAFHDLRFPPISRLELSRLKIEVSILSVPKKLDYKNSLDLLKKIKLHPGVILKKKNYIATYLPQVWNEINNEQEFLESLSLKAGLDKDGWKGSDIFVYNVDSISEKL